MPDVPVMERLFGELFKTKLPRHTYALFEKSGHHPSLEEPERFDQTLLAWVHGLDSPDGS